MPQSGISRPVSSVAAVLAAKASRSDTPSSTANAGNPLNRPKSESVNAPTMIVMMAVVAGWSTSIARIGLDSCGLEVERFMHAPADEQPSEAEQAADQERYPPAERPHLVGREPRT